LVCRVLYQPPEGLSRSDILPLHVTGDLIVCHTDHKGRTVRSLVDILVDILYSLYSRTHLDVNVGSVLVEQVQVVWDYLAVVTDDLLAWYAWLADRERLAVVTLAIL
jgi:hypothetical protein